MSLDLLTCNSSHLLDIMLGRSAVKPTHPIHGRLRTRTSHVTLAVAAPSGSGNSRVLTGPCVITIHSKTKLSTPITPRQAATQAKLDRFMSEATERFSRIELPLGAKLTPLDSSHVEISVPRLQLLDVWIQPRAVATVTPSPGRVRLTSATEDCVLSGSSHVEQLRLNDKFNLAVLMDFTWVPATAMINVDWSLEVKIDIPPPFSFIPAPVLETTGDAAFGAIMPVIINAFLGYLARDYSKWAMSNEAAGIY